MIVLAINSGSSWQKFGLPQVARFGIAFHTTLPDAGRVLPIPGAMQTQRFQRYRFHGLSCESVVVPLARELPQGLPEQLLIHLLRHNGGNAEALEAKMNQQSGLLGISGLHGEMRRLHEAESTNADARLAAGKLRVAVAKPLAAMAMLLVRADLIVFSGGIGESDAHVRTAICDALYWFGVALDADGNRRGQAAISAATSSCAVRAVASQEDSQIARRTAHLFREALP